MRKRGGMPSRRHKFVTLAAISPPGVAPGRFVGGHESGLAGCKSPPLLKRAASSCSSQRQPQREPLGASSRPSAPTYLPTSTAPFVVLTLGYCPSCCGVVPCVGMCGCSPCFRRYTPCRPGSGYAGTV